MAVFDAHSKELLLLKYNKEGGFTADQITNNDLTGIELPGSTWDEVNVEGCYLTHAVLTGMHSFNTVIQQSDLKEIDMSTSRQEAMLYSNSYLIKADWQAAHLYNMRFINCVAHSIDFRGVSLVNAQFTECEMNKAKFGNAMLMKTAFFPGKKGDLAGLVKSDFSSALVVDCSFKGVNLNQIEITGTTFIQCDFSGAQLEGIDLRAAHFIGCKFDNLALQTNLGSSWGGESLFGANLYG